MLQSVEIIPWLGHWWSYSRGHVSEGRCPIDNVQATNSGKQRSMDASFRHDHVTCDVQLDSAFTVNGQPPPS